MELDKNFWSDKYLQNNVPWDAGNITTPIKEYVDQLKNKELKILIPGVGNGHELSYLYNNGYKNVYGLDISEEPIANFIKNNPFFLNDQLIVDDFFNHKGQYDLILEQTFFCALNTALRPLYVEKMNELLNKNGKLAGVLFSFPLTQKMPPFGGNIEEYKQLFSTVFSIRKLEICYNSIKPRLNNEYFIILHKK